MKNQVLLSPNSSSCCCHCCCQEGKRSARLVLLHAAAGSYWNLRRSRFVKNGAFFFFSFKRSLFLKGSGFGQADGTFHFRTTFLPLENQLDPVLQKMAVFHKQFMDKYRN